MKILLNAIPFQGLVTGINRYLINLYREIEKNPDVTVTYFDSVNGSITMPVPKESGAWIRKTERIRTLPAPLIAAVRIAKWMSYEFRVSHECRQKKYDLYHETAHTPCALNATTPQVFTLHDLSLMNYGEMHPRDVSIFYDFISKKRHEKADHIITVSNFIRQEVCEKLSIPQDRVTAIHLAADPCFIPRSGGEIRQVIDECNIPEDYILFVGTLEPRKNLSSLINALASIETKIPLVLAGWQGWGDKKWVQQLHSLGLTNRVYITGYLDEASLSALYSGALALVYPSIYEGFGLPILEAMACGSPVICSNVASMPEVAGNAAFLVDPNDIEHIGFAIEKVINDRKLREEMIQKGLKRAGDFSWKTTAQKTVQLFKQTAETI